MKLRFTASSAVSDTPVSNFNLAYAGGTVAATSTTGYSIFQAVKLKKVEVWSPPASQGSAATCSLIWSSNSTNYAPQMEISDTSNSVTEPAHIVAVPPAKSLASDWILGPQTTIATGQSLFNLTCPAGSIIDVDLVGMLADGNTMTAVTLAGATVGTTYYQPLNGDGGVLIPVSKTVGP